jgi:hypothetical protein
MLFFLSTTTSTNLLFSSVMNNLDKFQNTVAILVKAYLEGTLQKGNCAMCAVGNLVAAALDLDMNMGNGPCWLTKQGDYILPTWFSVDNETQRKAIGYTRHQVSRIEDAFEGWYEFEKDEDESEFGGLMRVVEVLADIHQIDLSTKEAAKALFVKA